jgi:hypothetical protein
VNVLGRLPWIPGTDPCLECTAGTPRNRNGDRYASTGFDKVVLLFYLIYNLFIKFISSAFVGADFSFGTRGGIVG